MKKIIFVFFLIMILSSSYLFAYSIGPSTATVATNVANWTDWTASQLSSKDDQWATTNQTAATGTLSGFDFSGIPAGSSIDGIVVHIQASESHVQADGYLMTYLSWDNGTSYTSGYRTPDSGELPTSDTDYNEGGASDTWGHSWTVSEVTSTFKVKIWGYCANTARLTQVDYVAVTIYYSDGISPGAITTLSALTSSVPGAIDLTWTAPGDDGYTDNIVGGKYRIKASTDPGYSFVYTDYTVEIPTSTTQGAEESYTLSDLTSGATYYIRIWTADEKPNWSEISNGATTWAQVVPEWWDSSWLYRKKLTFDNSSQTENLVDFPVLVKLTSSNFNFGVTKSNGEDVRFIDANNYTELKYEIERWDNSAKQAIIWVKVPKIDGGSNEDFIYMYYGNSSAYDNQSSTSVWTNGYAAVYHFSELSGYYQDSTKNSNDANTQQVTSRNNTDANGLGYYPRFVETSGDYVGVPDNNSLDFGTGDFTVMVRAKSSTTQTDSDLVRKGSTGVPEDSWWKLEWGPTVNNRVAWSITINGTEKIINYNTLNADGNWHDIWGTRDTTNTEIELFIDGISKNSAIGNNGNISNSWNIGIGSKDTYNDDFYTGYLDEVRLASVLRSDDWISAQSKSMNNTFINVGNEESPKTAVSKYTGGSPTVPPSVVDKNTTANCLGTFHLGGEGEISQITITEYGTCDAPNDLENVKLFKDDGDGNWELTQDTTQLGSTTTFSGASSTATFSGFSLTAGATGYVHVILDVKDTATYDQTIGIEILQSSHVTSTKEVAATSWPVQLGTSTISVPEITVSDYTGGTPAVPPSTVNRPSTNGCLGTFKFDGTGTISQITITEYGTCDADGDLENVKLFSDDGDGNWEDSEDTNQLGSTTTFNASNKATFSGLSLYAGSETYVHVVLDVKLSATDGQTVGIELYQDDIVCTSTTTAASWPVQLGCSTIQYSTSESFQDGVYPTSSYSGTRDTHIRSDNPTTNYGATSPSVTDGDAPDSSCIIKWDISSLPQDATVTAVTITVNVTDESDDTYGIYEMKRDWVEGNGTSGSGADWNTYDGSTNWGTAGAQSTTDRGSTLLGSITSPGATGLKTITLNSSGVALVQAWINGTKTNYGLIFQEYTGATNGIQWTSREGATASNRPKLTITYTIPANTDVSAYTEGTPSVPPDQVQEGSAANCLGTFKFSGAGTISQITIKEYGTCNAANDLENVKLFEDDGDGNWESAQDTTQLGSTTTFSGASSTATFSGFSLVACSTCYVHIVLDVKDTATPTDTVGIEISSSTDVTSTKNVAASSWPVQLGTASIGPFISVSKYAAGTPTVPPSGVVRPSTHTCLGTFLFNGTGTISQITVTEYGTCDADSDLENVKLFRDDGDGNWEKSQDTTQLGSTTTFNASNKATFSSLNLIAGSTTYVHVVLDVKSSATIGQTIGIELYQDDIVCTSTTTASSWPVQLGTSSIGGQVTVSNYTGGTPIVPPSSVSRPSTHNCLGTFLFDGTGTISQMTLTEYGTCDADSDLENVKLFQDDGDGNWESSQDTTQLGSTTTFNASNKATFSGLSLEAGSAAYVHVVLDVKSTASDGAGIGIELYQDDIVCTSTTTATSWPVKLGECAVNWWDAWLYRKKLTFDNSSQTENLIYFPVLVKLTSSNFNFSQAKSNGEDIRFVDADGTTELKYEIEKWDSSGQEAIIWVKVPQINGSSNQDFIYMYYGNSSATDNQDRQNVWTNSYMDVFHFAETSGNYIESTSNGNHGTTVNVLSRTATGKMGLCPEFNGSSNRITCGKSSTLGDVTVAAWVYLDTAVNYRPVIQHAASGETEETNIVYGLEIDSSRNLWSQWEYGAGTNETCTSTATVSLAGWTYAVLVRNATSNQVKWYIDGSLASITSFTNDPTGGTSASCYLYIGGRITSAQWFDGKIDELRISSTPRSADWIAAQYKSMNDTFINVGSAEPRNTVVSAYTNGIPTVPPSTVNGGTTNNCLGTFNFSGSGTISEITLTEYGTCDANNELENVKLFQDDGDGNWESSQDTTQLGSTTTFSGASSTATFSGFSLVACSTCYVHVTLDVKSTGSHNSTVGIQIAQASDVTSTKCVTASSWPAQLGTSTIKDVTSPEAVTTLSALTGTYPGEIELSWTSPGDDGWSNDFDSGSEFDIRYSTTAEESPATSTTTFANALSVSEFSPIPSPVTALWPYSMTVSDLTPGVVYYFAMRTRDEVPNWSGLSNGATAQAQVAEDTTSPAAITDLTGQCNSDTGNVTLYWSTPGDDNWTNTLPEGSKYRIDYSTYSIDWSTATYDVEIPTHSVAPHTQVSHTITGLTGDTTWYFQIWTRDEVPNWSGLSNGATIWVNPVLSVSISTDTYDFGEVPLGQSTYTVSVITVTNDGNINETYSLKISSVTLYDDSPSLWKSTDTTTGHNRFIFYGIFHGTDVASGYFELNDAVVDENRSSTSDRYTYEDGSPPYKQTGVGVPADEERKIWFRVDMPISTTTGKKEKIKVTITAGPE